MSKPVTASVMSVSLTLLVACGTTTSRADVEGSDRPTAPVSSSVSTPPSESPSGSPTNEPTGRATTRSPGPLVTERDLDLMSDLVSFATGPSTETARRLPFAAQVQLGLSRDLIATLDRDDAPEPSAWVLDAESFRGYVGPFSALDLMRRHAEETRSTSVRGPRRAFRVSVGDHPHCAGPPVAAPAGFERHRRVSIQPADASIDSCLSWFTVDLFVSEEGDIAGVTLDVWEP